jgi:uncharacterized repeat protein (TIGR01451 family)
MKSLITLFIALFASAFTYSQTLLEVPLPDFGTVQYWHHNDTLSVVSTSAGNLYVRQRHSSEWIKVQETFSVIHGVSVSITDIIVVGVTPDNPGLSGILYTSDLGQTWSQLRPMSVFGSGVGYNNFKSTLGQFFFTWGFGEVKRYNYNTGVVTEITNTVTNLLSTYSINIIGSNIYRYLDNSNGFVNYTTYTGPLLGSLQPMYHVPGQTNVITYSDGTSQLIVDRNIQKIYTRGPGIPSPHVENDINVNGSLINFDVICRNGVFYVKFRTGTVTHLQYSLNGVDFQSAILNEIVPDFKLVEVLPDGRLLVNSSTLLVFDPLTQKMSPFDKGMKEAVVTDVSMNDYGDLILNCKNIVYTKQFDDTVFTPHLNTPKMATCNRVNASNSRTFYAFGPEYHLLRKTLTNSDFEIVTPPNASVKINFANNDSLLRCTEQGAFFSFNGGNQYQPSVSLPVPPPYSAAIFLAQSPNANNCLYRQHIPGGASGILRTHDFGSTWQAANNLPINGYDLVSQFAIDDSAIYYSQFVPGSLQDNVQWLDNSGNSIIINTVNRSPGENIRQKGIWVENNDLYISEVIHANSSFQLLIRKADQLVNPFTTIHQLAINNQIDSANTICNSQYFTLKVCGKHKFFSGVTNGLYRLSTETDSSFLPAGGKVYFDLNSNNFFDAGDAPASGMLIQSSTGLNTTADAQGNYQYAVASPNTVLTITPPNGYTCLPAQQVVNPANTNMDFALQISSAVHDLSVTHVNITGFINQAYSIPIVVTCKNEGTIAQAGALKFVIHSGQAYYTGNYNLFPDSISGDTLIWNLPVMQPQQSLVYSFIVGLSPGLPVGTPFTFESQIIPDSGNDINWSNNVFSNQYAYGILQDHTYKVANPVEYNLQQVQDNDYIHYTIYFRNYGPGNAFHVQLTDTLSPLLDASSFVFTGSSHPYFNTQLQNHVLNVFYPAINLPDSNSATFQNDYTGYYQFKIKPFPGWSVADTIYNTAHVTMDYYTQSNTNEAFTFQPVVTSMQNKPTIGFSVYPNPASRFIIVEGLESGDWVYLLDASGRQVDTYFIHQKRQMISLPDLSPGLYFIRSSTEAKKLLIGR